MTYLAMINRAQAVLNLPVTSYAFGHTGEAQVQLKNLAQIEGVETADEFAWQALTTEASFTTTATENQTGWTKPSDFGWIVNETLYNRSAVKRYIGPIGPREWQDQLAFGNAGADGQFRFRGDTLRIIPTPTASQSVFYEYVSNKWCQSSGGTAQGAWAADTDTGKISEHVMTLGIIWRWKMSKGLAYAEDFNAWEMAKNRAAARDGAKRKLSAAGPSPRRISNGNIAEGSWS